MGRLLARSDPRDLTQSSVLGTTDTHEKCAIMQVCRMLVGLEDIPLMLKNKSRDGRYDAWLVWTRNQQRNHVIGCALASIDRHVLLAFPSLPTLDQIGLILHLNRPTALTDNHKVDFPCLVHRDQTMRIVFTAGRLQTVM